MRATILSALFLTLGALVMSTATADDKDEKKETKVKITVKSWDAQGKKFLDPKEGVDARRVENKGRITFFITAKQAVGTGEPRKGSEITDADGTVYVVKDADPGLSTGQYRAICEKKP